MKKCGDPFKAPKGEGDTKKNMLQRLDFYVNEAFLNELTAATGSKLDNRKEIRGGHPDDSSSLDSEGSSDGSWGGGRGRPAGVLLGQRRSYREGPERGWNDGCEDTPLRERQRQEQHCKEDEGKNATGQSFGIARWDQCGGRHSRGSGWPKFCPPLDDFSDESPELKPVFDHSKLDISLEVGSLDSTLDPDSGDDNGDGNRDDEISKERAKYSAASPEEGDSFENAATPRRKEAGDELFGSSATATYEEDASRDSSGETLGSLRLRAGDERGMVNLEALGLDASQIKAEDTLEYMGLAGTGPRGSCKGRPSYDAGGSGEEESSGETLGSLGLRARDERGMANLEALGLDASQINEEGTLEYVGLAGTGPRGSCKGRPSYDAGGSGEEDGAAQQTPAPVTDEEAAEGPPRKAAASRLKKKKIKANGPYKPFKARPAPSATTGRARPHALAAHVRNAAASCPKKKNIKGNDPSKPFKARPAPSATTGRGRPHALAAHVRKAAASRPKKKNIKGNDPYKPFKARPAPSATTGRARSHSPAAHVPRVANAVPQRKPLAPGKDPYVPFKARPMPRTPGAASSATLGGSKRKNSTAFRTHQAQNKSRVKSAALNTKPPKRLLSGEDTSIAKEMNRKRRPEEVKERARKQSAFKDRPLPAASSKRSRGPLAVKELVPPRDPPRSGKENSTAPFPRRGYRTTRGGQGGNGSKNTAESSTGTRQRLRI